MASSPNQSQASRTPLFPVEIKFGDFPPVPLTNLLNQTCASIPASIRPSHSQLQSGLSPLSPQLRRKQPRILASPPSSRMFSQSSPPPTETVALIASGSYCKVPSNWCPDDRIWSRDLYLSRNSLLKKLIHQGILYRTNESSTVPSYVDEYRLYYDLGIEIFGSPLDYWVTFPLYPPTGLEIEDLPELNNVDLCDLEGISIAHATGPVKPSRYALNRLVGADRESDYDGLPFEWVTNTTGTKFLHRNMMVSNEIEDIVGFVECPICKQIWFITYLVPERFDAFDSQLGRISELVYKFGENVLQKSHFDCRCDGKLNPVRPIISEDMNKINWMFLFLGFGIGHCTVDQLKYYCMQRKLPVSESNKKKLLVAVFGDLCQQIINPTV